MEITISDQTEELTESQLSEISSLLDFAGDYLRLTDDTEMSVTFMSNETIQNYNREYREKDAPTDVISFAIEDEEDVSREMFEQMGIPRNLGDILVSVEKAHEQAVDYGHSFERELGFLVIHGFLHLNGYDHMTKEEETEMFSLQRKILDAYGLERK